MSPALTRAIELLRRSPLLRVLWLGGFVLLLQIPIAMIDGLIESRRATRDEAVEEVTASWGRGQRLLGPFLAVPLRRGTAPGGEGSDVGLRRRGYVVLLPEELQVDGRLGTETRNRGIFQIPLYRMEATLTGRFGSPPVEELGIDPGELDWSGAQLWLELSDTRALQSPTSLSWKEASIELRPGTGSFGGGAAGIHARLGAGASGGGRFRLPLAFHGSGELWLAPLGRETRARLTSNWPDPSFRGAWLPSQRAVDGAGFEAEWQIPSLGRSYPQSWISGAIGAEGLEASCFGLDLLTPVDPYRMAERSVKYEVLFLSFTFLSLWMFEVLASHRLHGLQYLLVGAALCVFYLLELSLAEHLGFGVAYLLAASAVVLLLVHYAAGILRRRGRAVILGTIVTALYGFLYLLLRNQDYALLAGSLGLFAILAAVMSLTRHLDWDRPAASGPERPARTG